MDRTMPQGSGTAPTGQQAPCSRSYYHSDKEIVFAVGVVLLVFGPAITGFHQASMIGLALIVLCSLL